MQETSICTCMSYVAVSSKFTEHEATIECIKLLCVSFECEVIIFTLGQRGCQNFIPPNFDQNNIRWYPPLPPTFGRPPKVIVKYISGQFRSRKPSLIRKPYKPPI